MEFTIKINSSFQGDHSPDNVKFPDGSQHSFTALGMLSDTHIMPVLVLNTCMDANIHLTINSFRQLFPDKIFPLTFSWLLVKSLTFLWQLSNSLTFPGFPDKWSPWSLHATILHWNVVKQISAVCTECFAHNEVYV